MALKYRFVFSDGDKRTELTAGRTALWDATDEAAGIPETRSKSQKSDYIWGYFAAKQAGKLEELGVSGVEDPIEAAYLLADAYDLEITEDKGEAPLA